MGFLKNIFGKKDKDIYSYDDFWNWFLKYEKKFHKVIRTHHQIEKDFFDKIAPKLNKVKDGVFFLAGMFDDHTAELVLTPDGNINNIVFIEELIQAAPKINGWIFTALKQESDIAEMGISMNGTDFSSENMSFYAESDSNYPDEINITIIHNDINKDNKNDIGQGVFIFLDNFLGEMYFISSIDHLDIISIDEAKQEIIPINKLKSFLKWRHKEFVEKYKGTRYDTENDNFTALEAELKNGNKLIAVINTDLLQWDSKASHPWILNIDLKYKGINNSGMPDKETYQLLNDIEDEIMGDLKDSEGYLNIGRETANDNRTLFFACRNFRLPSKIAYNIQLKYKDVLEIEYNIYKDKYWNSFNKYTKNIY